MGPQLEFLIIDERRFEELVKNVDACAHHSYLSDGTLISAIGLLVPTLQGETVALISRKLHCPDVQGAENEIRNAARVLAREIKAIVEFKDEFEQTLYMDDEGIPVEVGKESVRILRGSMGFPSITVISEEAVINLVRD